MFLDTSALAKRYVAEPGSEQVLALCMQADELGVCSICLPELVSTFSRLVREKRLTATQYRLLKERALADLEGADICQITSGIIVSAVALLESYPLKALDALHLASAIAMDADLFVSADRQQSTAARKAGLKAINLQ